MAESSAPFNSLNGDRKYNAEDLAAYIADFIGNGIFKGGLICKVMAAGSMDIKVLEGKAYINGKRYLNYDAPKQLTLEPAHLTMSRIDKVVIRLDNNLPFRSIKATIKVGEASINPIAPILERNNAIWELGLADIRVNQSATVITDSNITDLRMSEQCGIVTGLVDQADLNDIFNQFYAKWQEVSADMDANEEIYQEWYEGFKDMAELAFNQRINDFDAWFNANKTGIFDAKYFDFDNAVYRAGHTATTVKRADGSYLESIINTLSRAIYATRETTKQADGAWVSHVICHKHNVDITEITRKVNGVWESVVEYTGSALAVGSFKVGEALVGGGNVARSIERIIPEKTDWIDYQTPVDAENMNKIEGSLQTLDVDKVSRGNIKVDAGTF